MDILSDINVVGNITTNSLTTGILRTPTSPLKVYRGTSSCYADVCGNTLYSNNVINKWSIKSGSICAETICTNTLHVGINCETMLYVSGEGSFFCKQVLFDCDVASSQNYPSCVDYFTKKRNVRITVPSDCTVFKILEEPQYIGNNMDLCPYPLIQAFDNSTKRSVTMDYKFDFCFDCTSGKTFVSVFGEKSSGTTATDFSFGVLLEQRYGN